MLRPAAIAPAACLALLAACGGRASRPAAVPSVAGAVAPGEGRQPRPDVLLARARALRAEGDLEGARARLEAAHQASPAADDVRVELADVLVADGRELDRAAELLAGVQGPGDARLHLVTARLAEVRGDDAGAEASYAVALAVEPDPDVRLRRALALERLTRYDEATAELELVRADRPDDVLARARLADRYEAAGRLREAEAELVRAAEAQPDRAAGWERLARFYERAGRGADARAAQARARAAAGRDERGLRPLLPSRR